MSPPLPSTEQTPVTNIDSATMPEIYLVPRNLRRSSFPSDSSSSTVKPLFLSTNTNSLIQHQPQPQPWPLLTPEDELALQSTTPIPLSTYISLQERRTTAIHSSRKTREQDSQSQSIGPFYFTYDDDGNDVDDSYQPLNPALVSSVEEWKKYEEYVGSLLEPEEKKFVYRRYYANLRDMAPALRRKGKEKQQQQQQQQQKSGGGKTARRIESPSPSSSSYSSALSPFSCPCSLYTCSPSRYSRCPSPFSFSFSSLFSPSSPLRPFEDSRPIEALATTFHTLLRRLTTDYDERLTILRSSGTPYNNNTPSFIPRVRASQQFSPPQQKFTDPPPHAEEDELGRCFLCHGTQLLNDFEQGVTDPKWKDLARRIVRDVSYRAWCKGKGDGNGENEIWPLCRALVAELDGINAKRDREIEVYNAERLEWETEVLRRASRLVDNVVNGFDEGVWFEDGLMKWEDARDEVLQVLMLLEEEEEGEENGLTGRPLGPTTTGEEILSTTSDSFERARELMDEERRRLFGSEVCDEEGGVRFYDPTWSQALLDL